MSAQLPWLMGAMFPPQGGNPPRRRCRIFRQGGRKFAYDPSSGDTVEVEGEDDFGADGDDDDEDFGADSDLSGIDSEIMGAERDVRDLQFGIDTDSDDEFGAKEDRLERKLSNLKQDIEQLQNKIAKVRTRWRRNQLQKRLENKVDDYKRIKNKLDGAKSERRQAKRRAAAAAATVLGGSAAGAAMGLGAMQTGSALATREGVSPSAVNLKLLDPQMAQAIRNAQAQAGQRFGAVAPPGSGRLTRLTMYQEGETNPRNALTVPSGGITSATELTSEDIPFAVLKVVGFVTNTFGTATEANAIALVEDLKIKGGSNLFLNDRPHPATNYDSNNEQFAGLRNYPVLRSPNQATVNVYAAGDQNDVVIITCDVVTDVIQDDVYGSGLTGPYAG